MNELSKEALEAALPLAQSFCQSDFCLGTPCPVCGTSRVLHIKSMTGNSDDDVQWCEVCEPRERIAKAIDDVVSKKLDETKEKLAQLAEAQELKWESTDASRACLAIADLIREQDLSE